MSISNVKSTIKTLMESVDGIGIVHDYKRWTIDNIEFLNYFVKDNKINGWTIEVVSSNGIYGSIANLVDREYIIKITGYYGLKDLAETAKTFELLVEKIMDKVDWKKALTNSAIITSPCNATTFGEIMFSEWLCHTVTILLTVKDTIFNNEIDP